jgi:ketosteroid isomerase-like protein
LAGTPLDLVELVRQRFGAEGERRVWDEAALRDASETFWHPEIVYEEAKEWPGAGIFTGREAVLERFREYQEILGPAEAEIREIVDVGDGRVFLTFQYQAKSVSGMPVDQLWAYVFTGDEEGQTIRWQAFLDAEEAKRELGIA